LHDATEPGVLEDKGRERILTSGKITSAMVKRHLPVAARSALIFPFLLIYLNSKLGRPAPAAGRAAAVDEHGRLCGRSWKYLRSGRGYLRPSGKLHTEQVDASWMARPPAFDP
jgi:hypothetical protein